MFVILFNEMANQSTPHWNEELYEFLEFFYWEPQHIGRAKSDKSKYKDWSEVVDHLERMEVVLNHHFGLFFNLISNEQKRSILSALLKTLINDNLAISSANTREFESSINNFTQPDLLFKGRNSTVYVEMKVGAKSNCEQLFKYLVLHLLHEEMSGVKTEPYLLFLGTGDLTKFFQEKVSTIEELKQCFQAYEIPAQSKKGGITLADYQDRVLELLERIHITYANYQDVAVVLETERSKVTTETEQKLFDGMLAELKKRGLA